MKKLKAATYLIALILAVGPILGCGVINPHRKNAEGYYERHYYSCGPVALGKAFNKVYANEGIIFVRNPAPVKEISQKIQSEGMVRKELLAFFDNDAVLITWPSEIKKIADKYGFDIVTVDNLDALDPEKDVAIVLIHGEFYTRQYHWVVYPIDSVKIFYGKGTVIDAIYLLKWRGKQNHN